MVVVVVAVSAVVMMMVGIKDSLRNISVRKSVPPENMASNNAASGCKGCCQTWAMSGWM
jgi:hypothetical protein